MGFWCYFHHHHYCYYYCYSTTTVSIKSTLPECTKAHENPLDVRPFAMHHEVTRTKLLGEQPRPDLLKGGSAQVYINCPHLEY